MVVKKLTTTLDSPTGSFDGGQDEGERKGVSQLIIPEFCRGWL